MRESSSHLPPPPPMGPDSMHSLPEAKHCPATVYVQLEYPTPWTVQTLSMQTQQVACAGMVAVASSRRSMAAPTERFLGITSLLVVMGPRLRVRTDARRGFSGRSTICPKFFARRVHPLRRST